MADLGGSRNATLGNHTAALSGDILNQIQFIGDAAAFGDLGGISALTVGLLGLICSPRNGSSLQSGQSTAGKPRSKRIGQGKPPEAIIHNCGQREVPALIASFDLHQC